MSNYQRKGGQNVFTESEPEPQHSLEKFYGILKIKTIYRLSFHEVECFPEVEITDGLKGDDCIPTRFN